MDAQANDGQPQDPQAPDRLGEVDAEDHQGDEDGRRGEAAPGAGRAEAGRPYSSGCARSSPASRRSVTVGPQSPKLLAGTGKDQLHLLVVATTDRGLAGAFNTNIVRAARTQGRGAEAEGKTVQFYLVGRKGRPVIQRVYPKAIIGQYDTSAMKAPGYADAQAIAKDMIDRFDAASSTSPTSSTPSSSRAGCRSRRSTRSSRSSPPALSRDQGQRRRRAVEYEPDEEEILADLLPRNVAIQIYRALLENAGRLLRLQMTAMDNATRNAGDMINRLTIQYNRQRQAAITTELVEIISGAEAL